MYDNYMIPATVIGFIMLVFLSAILIGVGKYIDELPSGKRGKRSLSSPIPATRITSIICICIYIACAAVAVMTADKVYFIISTVGLFAVYMAMATSLIFSFAVINAINSKNKSKLTGVGNSESSIL